MSAIWLGVDPGFHGSIAAIHSDGRTEIVGMPVHRDKKRNTTTKTTIDGPTVRAWLRALGVANIKMAFIEKAIVMPRQGIVGAGAFVGGQRFISGIFCGMDIPYREVMPASWKKQLGIQAKVRGAKTGMGVNKELSVALAIELYPEADLSCSNKRYSHDMAEALLLAHLARKESIG